MEWIDAMRIKLGEFSHRENYYGNKARPVCCQPLFLPSSRELWISTRSIEFMHPATSLTSTGNHSIGYGKGIRWRYLSSLYLAIIYPAQVSGSYVCATDNFRTHSSASANICDYLLAIVRASCSSIFLLFNPPTILRRDSRRHVKIRLESFVR